MFVQTLDKVVLYPSSVTIADLVVLADKFGIPDATDIIARVSNMENNSNLRLTIRRKLKAVKGHMQSFSKYTEESCKAYLQSPFHTTDGKLKTMLKSSPDRRRSSLGGLASPLPLPHYLLSPRSEAGTSGDAHEIQGHIFFFFLFNVFSM